MKMYVNAAGDIRIKMFAAEALDDLINEYLEDPPDGEMDSDMWHHMHMLSTLWGYSMRDLRAASADMDDEQYDRYLMRTVSVPCQLTERDMSAIRMLVMLMRDELWNKNEASRADAEIVASVLGGFDARL